MGKWSASQAASAGIAGLALIGLVVLPAGIWLSAGLALAAVCGIGGYVRLDRRNAEARSQLELVRMMNTYRHDWMNDLQVLLGYISLQKYEKLQDYMDKINAKAHRESYLAKLGVPELTAFFYSYRLKNPPFELEVEIERELPLSRSALGERGVSRLIMDTVEFFESISLPSDGEPNVLNLAIDLEEDGLLLDFVYSGGYEREEAEKTLVRLTRSWSKGELQLEQIWKEREAAVTMRLPLHKQ